MFKITTEFKPFNLLFSRGNNFVMTEYKDIELSDIPQGYHYSGMISAWDESSACFVFFKNRLTGYDVYIDKPFVIEVNKSKLRLSFD